MSEKQYVIGYHEYDGEEWESGEWRIIGRVEAKAGTRYLVDGITHSKGAPIRFKSLERAERHIRNMRLETADYLNGLAR